MKNQVPQNMHNAVITISASWIYVSGIRVATHGFQEFRNWCILQNINVCTFYNWPFVEGVSCRLHM